MTTAELSKAVRAQLGLTQLQLGQLLDAHAITVCRWESGTYNPTEYQRALLEALAKVKVKDTAKVILRRGPIYALARIFRHLVFDVVPIK
jgi:transcriptional regulator with XRE-family HTH domain